MSEPKPLQHIAIICDGNRRWAKSQGMSPLEGHRVAVKETFPALVQHAADLGIPYLTFWIFGKDNWQRSKEEVENLMGLFETMVTGAALKDMQKKGARISIIGDRSDFSPGLRKLFDKTEKETAGGKKINVTLAMSYGGRDEIIRAQRRMLAENPGLKPEQINEDFFAEYLDSAGTPDPDLIIRTSGEQRLSGFMPWQSNYSEFYFSGVHFPEFREGELDEAIAEFNKRGRRFGK